MRNLNKILIVVLVASFGMMSCTKMEPLKEKGTVIECGIEPQSSAIMIDDSEGSSGITDPDHDEDHDKDDVVASTKN